jgi:hypothetical protein
MSGDTPFYLWCWLDDVLDKQKGPIEPFKIEIKQSGDFYDLKRLIKAEKTALKDIETGNIEVYAVTSPLLLPGGYVNVKDAKEQAATGGPMTGYTQLTARFNTTPSRDNLHIVVRKPGTRCLPPCHSKSDSLFYPSLHPYLDFHRKSIMRRTNIPSFNSLHVYSRLMTIYPLVRLSP